MGKKKIIDLCQQCGMKCETSCLALERLYELYREIKTEMKEDIISSLRADLEIRDSEVADDLRELGEKLIEKRPELEDIRSYDLKIGYVRCYYPKKEKGKLVLGDCRKVNKTFEAYLPFDFVITLYEPNIEHLSENQIKVLMLHELMHIEMGERGPTVRPHDIEDFHSILSRFGLEWSEYDKDVIDICS